MGKVETFTVEITKPSIPVSASKERKELDWKRHYCHTIFNNGQTKKRCLEYSFFASVDTQNITPSWYLHEPKYYWQDKHKGFDVRPILWRCGWSLKHLTVQMEISKLSSGTLQVYTCGQERSQNQAWDVKALYKQCLKTQWWGEENSSLHRTTFTSCVGILGIKRVISIKK